MLESVTIEDLSKLFKVFGDPTRIKILWALNVHDVYWIFVRFLI